MVSDFIEEATADSLCYDGKEARLLLETQQDGYFDSDKFLSQVDTAIEIFEEKFPHAQALFLFDNAPIHCKSSDNALSIQHMNVRPGGKQPIMKDTVFNGQVHQMVLSDGRPKGMKMVLQERGVDTKGMNAEIVRETFYSLYFFPKFHCELNVSKRNWCHTKKYSRKYSNGTITRLQKIVPEALDTCTPELNKKFFRKTRDYLRAYQGHTCWSVDKAVKQYKSHRWVFSADK